MIIGLTGKAGSGKSTAARILSNKMGFARKPLRYPVEAMLSTLGVPIALEARQTPCIAINGMTPASAIISLYDWGTIEFGEGFWTKIWARGLVGIVNVVVEDVAWPTEAAEIRRRGGKIIKIDRQTGEAGASGYDELSTLLPHDYCIWNDFAESDLEESLRRVISDVASLKTSVAAE